VSELCRGSGMPLFTVHDASIVSQSQPMRTKVIANTDFETLIDAMRCETEGCDQFWAASAFLSSAAVQDVLDSTATASMRILTGTMGNSTRSSTFKMLLKRSCDRVAVRVWHCGRHGDFHTKLYLWKTGSSGVAWIGSANFTDGGLTSIGETMLEIRAPWSSSRMKQLATAFNGEWRRGLALTPEFVARY
jgi:HKD family nuclease